MRIIRYQHGMGFGFVAFSQRRSLHTTTLLVDVSSPIKVIVRTTKKGIAAKDFTKLRGPNFPSSMLDVIEIPVPP
jgi:hypothetical protein